VNTRPQKPASRRTKGKCYSYQQGSVFCSYTTPEIVEYQRVNPFLEGQRTKAGEGEMSRHTHASKKNGEFQLATGVGQRHCSHGI
jgi:hypothetical protein